MRTPTTARLELGPTGATLTVRGHHYPITWDLEHPNPRPCAERELSRLEHANIIRWRRIRPRGHSHPKPVGWIGTLRESS